MIQRILLFTFMLALPGLAYNQETGIQIQLKDSSSLETNFLQLKSQPLWGKPHIRIDAEKGPKIYIQDLEAYLGYDQNGSYTRFTNLSDDAKRIQYTAQSSYLDTTAQLKLYYVDYLKGKNSQVLSRHKVYYSLSGAPYQKMTYRTVKRDFDARAYSNASIQKAQSLHLLQVASALVASGLMLSAAMDATWGLPADMQVDHTYTYMASAALLVLPLTLEIPKRKQVLKALKEVN